MDVLRALRQEMGFRLLGWVLMPDHFHLLLRPEPAEMTSLILQELKKQTALRILTTLRKHRQHRWSQKMLASLRLPPTVHDES